MQGSAERDCVGVTDGGGATEQRRHLAQEVPVALVCQGACQAVMMCSPIDLEDFAVGFCLSEGIVVSVDQIETLEIAEHSKGLEARMWLSPERGVALGERRRTMAGPVGCGMCGLESLDQALRVLPPLPARCDDVRLSRDAVMGGLDDLRLHQPLHDLSRAVHAAGFLRPGAGIVMAREDVGRHNALDKLIGGLARAGVDICGGAVVLTSRVSLDMVQKCAMVGVPVVIAAGAPSDLAQRTAAEIGMTLATSVRRDGFDIWSGAERIVEECKNVV